MTLFEKLETDVEINAPTSKFREIIHARTHHISNVSTDKIQRCELHKGEWGKVGSIIYWNYFHDGKALVAKDLIEAVDEENNLITFKVIEGDILEHYKSFKFTIQCIPKDKGSVVHLTMEYEKRHEEIPDLHGLLQFCVNICKDIDAHLMECNQGPSIDDIAAAAQP